MEKSLTIKDRLKRYGRDWKFAFYCITHPVDGYWDLSHEKRGSYSVATTILILTIVTELMNIRCVGFLFQDTYWPEENIFRHIGSIVLPLALWCVANWGTTTLFNGKGRLGVIYIATCYGFIPYWLLNIPLIILSNFVALNEAGFIEVFSVIALVWCGFLIFNAMMQIHEFTFSKAFIFTIFSIFGMCVIVFVLLIFFSMISDGIAYFVSLYREVVFRM